MTHANERDAYSFDTVCGVVGPRAISDLALRFIAQPFFHSRPVRSRAQLSFRAYGGWF